MENNRFKSLHRGYFEIDEASLRSLELSMSGHVAFEVSKVFFYMSSTSVSVIIIVLSFSYRGSSRSGGMR
jgi:hypothetical protein